MHPDLIPSVFHHRPFKLFLCARAATFMAFQMLAVAVGWQIYELTGSAMYLGLVGLAQFMPMFLLTLVVGHVATVTTAAVLHAYARPLRGWQPGCWRWAVFSGWQSKWSILIIIFIVGGGRAFEGPSLQALLPGLIR